MTNCLQEIMTTIAEILKALGCLVAIISAIIAWKKERKISSNIKKDQFNRTIEQISSEFEELLKQAIAFWSDSDLTKGKRSVLEVQITSTYKNISLKITDIKKNFPDLVGDTQDLVNMLNDLNQEITGGSFQTKNFKTDTNKAKLIVSEATFIRKFFSTLMVVG